jgi:hypothetical protein
MLLIQITFLKPNVLRFSLLSGFSNTAFPLVNPHMDVRAEPEFGTKIEERKTLLYISLHGGNADGSEGGGEAVVVIVF